jgi:hypothetical protein
MKMEGAKRLCYQWLWLLSVFWPAFQVGNFWHKGVPTPVCFWRDWHSKKPRAKSPGAARLQIRFKAIRTLGVPKVG